MSRFVNHHKYKIDAVRRSGPRSGQDPLLVRAGAAGPQVHDRAVGGVVAGPVEALARLRVAERAVGLGGPVLGTRAVARPQLDLGAVGRAAAGDVEALVERLERLPSDGPGLRTGAVAGVQLDLGAVGGAAA